MRNIWRRIMFAIFLVVLVYSIAVGLRGLLQAGLDEFFNGILLLIDGAAACGIVLCTYFEYEMESLNEKITATTVSHFPKMMNIVLKDLQDKGLLHPGISLEMMATSGGVVIKGPEDQDTNPPPGDMRH